MAKQTACGIGYHILHDKMAPWQRARLLTHLAVVQPATVNVTGAEQYPASLRYVQQILDACPNTIVFERRVDRPAAYKVGRETQDEGIWQIDVNAWYDWRVRPYLDILSQPRVVVVYDNESNMGDFTPYAEQMAVAAKRADEDGVALGLGRFSTGTPGEEQYAQLGAMWTVLTGSRHWWTMNEYMGPDAQSSAGHVERYKHGLAQLKKSQKMNIAIGEWAVCAPKGRGLDAHHSILERGWSEEQTLDYMITMFTTWYQPKRVPVNVWLADNLDPIWRRFAVGEAFYEALEVRLGEVQISWPPQAISGDSGPAPDWQSTQATLRHMGGDTTLFVREGPSTATARIGHITAEVELAYQWPPVTGDPVDDLGDQWLKVRVHGVQGFAFAYYLAVPEQDPTRTDSEEPPVKDDGPSLEVPVDEPDDADDPAVCEVVDAEDDA